MLSIRSLSIGINSSGILSFTAIQESLASVIRLPLLIYVLSFRLFFLFCSYLTNNSDHCCLILDKHLPFIVASINTIENQRRLSSGQLSLRITQQLGLFINRANVDYSSIYQA